MKRRDFVRGLAVATTAPVVLSSLGCSDGDAGERNGTDTSGTTGMGGGAGSERQNRLWPGYGDAIVIDALASPIQFNIPQSRLPLSESDLTAVQSSGIAAMNVTVSMNGSLAERPFEGTLARMAAWEREIDTRREVLARVRSANDIRSAKESGRLGIIHGFQDTVPFEDDLDRIGLFHGLGVRIVQLTYNDTNRVGSGCLVDRDDGLTGFGRQAVGVMDDLGMLVDLSHCGGQTTLDGIRASRRPVGITHSGCSAVFPHPRNKDDATLREMADGGGVVGIYLMPFLNPSGPPTADDVMDHIDHALDVCGADHVGIGSDQGIVPLDFGGDFMTQFAVVSKRRQAAGIAAPREDTPPVVPELNEPRRMEIIAERMATRGHASSVIEKVIGANFLRLFEDVWG